MAKSKSSSRWLQEHFDDYYVKLSQKHGYRSRAVYKLIEILEKDRLIKPNMNVVDLGAAPGGWSQYASELVKPKGSIVACDLLEIDPLPFVEFVQGDFSSDETYETILQLIDQRQIDVVISDIAPNFSGVESVDIPKSMMLVELAFDFCKQVFEPGRGAFVVKMFQGEGSDQLLQQMREYFTTVKVRKPKASRPRSREVYVVATRPK